MGYTERWAEEEVGKERYIEREIERERERGGKGKERRERKQQSLWQTTRRRFIAKLRRRDMAKSKAYLVALGLIRT